MVLADAPGWLLAHCLTMFVITTGKIGPSQHSREVVKKEITRKSQISPNFTGVLSPVLTLGLIDIIICKQGSLFG